MTVGQSSFPGQPHGGSCRSKLQFSSAERHRSQPMGGGWPARPAVAVWFRDEVFRPPLAKGAISSRRAAYCGLPRGVAAAAIGRTRPSLGPRILQSSSRFAESSSLASGRGGPVRVPSGTAPEDDFLQAAVRLIRHVEQLRPVGSREPPPPRAVRDAARHPKAGFFFAKPAGVGPQEGLAKLGSTVGG